MSLWATITTTYEVVQSPSIPVLEEKVNKLISEGREPIGGISTIGSRYLQALVITQETDDCLQTLATD